MTSFEKLARDKHLSLSTRLVGAEILRKMDPVTGRARITAEQLADTLRIGGRNSQDSDEHPYRPQLLPRS